jgi:polysaccharide deacetylase family protein (PEP-CTERM system associated)
MIAHHFTVDVEEHFQVSALAPYVPRDTWETLESRVEANNGRILALLDRFGAKGTFFVLGWVAERHPALVRAIAAGGHEVASHGWDHRRVTALTPDEFRDQARRSKQLLEGLAGAPVLGYRAPSYSITRGYEWALDILLEEGYQYDSSLFPIYRPGYGYPSGGRDPYWIPRSAGQLGEVPPATRRLAGVNLPAAGGAYFRHFPYSFVAGALRAAARRGTPGTFFIHPWELDPEQPRFSVPPHTRLRHYGGLSRAVGRLERLLAEFRFTSVRTTMEQDRIPGRRIGV